MANRRMISKSISTSIRISKVSMFAKLLFTWLVPHCDDGGNMDAEPYIVRGIVVPLCKESPEEVAAALKELEENGLITIYEKENGKFLHIEKWEDHQTLRGDRPDFRYPDAGKPAVNQRATTGHPNRTEQNRTKQNGTERNTDQKFNEFWIQYPRKIAKKTAYTSWNRIKDIDDALIGKIMESLEEHKKSAQWQKDDGKFIPHPSTWLNQERWNDDLKVRNNKAANSKYDNL